MGRAPCCEKDSVKRGPWTPEEDAKLLACISQYGTGSWRTLPKKAGLQRCGKSCRLRWTNYLRPDLKHGRFSEQEEQLIVKLHAALGSRWSLIAAQLPGRTDNDVKNYWNTRLKKKLCEMGIDPITHKPISQLLADLAGSMTLPKGTEIAEATLGCFKDDMLNVLMRRRSDAASNNINMSFAPLLLQADDNHQLPDPASATAPVSENKPLQLYSFRSPPDDADGQLLHENMHTAFRCQAGVLPRWKMTSGGVPCGPVGGIRSAAGAALAARNCDAEHQHPSGRASANSKMDQSDGFLNDAMMPGFCTFETAAGLAMHGRQSNVQYNTATAEVNIKGDPNCSSRSALNALDVIADQARFSDFQEVLDLNLMHSKINRRGNRFQPGPADQIIAPGATSQEDGMQVEQGQLQDCHRQAIASTQDARMYTRLLQQQEKQCTLPTCLQHENHSEVGNLAISMEERCNQLESLGGSRDKSNLGVRPLPSDTFRINPGTRVAANTEERTSLQWSPVSYTNSGSSSSNLSLSMSAPAQIAPLDTVLASDALLWDLSELGSMVS